MKFNNDAIRELSYGALSLQEGSKEGYAWKRELNNRKSFLFAWQTELVNPKYLPDWVRLKDADMECEILWNYKIWQESRERDWKRKTGFRNLLGNKFQNSHITIDPKLAKVPTEKDTRKLFTSIINTIPPTVHDWSDLFMRLFPQYKNEGIFLIDRNFGLDILPGVLEFIIAAPFGKASQSKNHPSTLTDIKSPLIDIDACEEQIKNRMRHQTLQLLRREPKPSRSEEEVEALFRNDIELVFEQAEAQIAAEESRRDKELQEAMREYHANLQTEGK